MTYPHNPTKNPPREGIHPRPNISPSGVVVVAETKAYQVRGKPYLSRQAGVLEGHGAQYLSDGRVAGSTFPTGKWYSWRWYDRKPVLIMFVVGGGDGNEEGRAAQSCY